jgi:hypothetical protein
MMIAKAMADRTMMVPSIGAITRSFALPHRPEHITFNGDYVWPTEPLQQEFRPLRNPRTPFLEAA